MLNDVDMKLFGHGYIFMILYDLIWSYMILYG